ncbi:MAG: porin family protein [Bacteroidales bacterium]
MKNVAKFNLLTIFLLFAVTLKSQVLISILLGDKLNSPKIEFGMNGGLNRSFLNDINGSKGNNNFNLGFYFHINLKNSSYLSTGIMVKSSVGATGMPVYAIGNADFDSTYKDGTLTKKISVFYLPLLFQQRFNDRWYLEAGPQAGLRTKAVDIFESSSLGGELTYTKNVKDQYARLDFGFTGGVGYKFKKEPKSMAVGVNYYYGLVNVSKTPDVIMKNSSLYCYIKIPIGVGKEPVK